MATTWSIVGMFVAEVFDRRLAGKVSSRLLWAAWMAMGITASTPRLLKFCNCWDWSLCLAPCSLWFTSHCSLACCFRLSEWWACRPTLRHRSKLTEQVYARCILSCWMATAMSRMRSFGRFAFRTWSRQTGLLMQAETGKMPQCRWGFCHWPRSRERYWSRRHLPSDSAPLLNPGERYRCRLQTTDSFLLVEDDMKAQKQSLSNLLKP